MTIRELSSVMTIDSVVFHCHEGDLSLLIGNRHCYDDLEIDHVVALPFDRVETRVVLGKPTEVKYSVVEVRAILKGLWDSDEIPTEEEE